MTLNSYRDALKPVCKRLGGRKLQDITKRDGDELTTWMLSEGRQSVRHYRPESLPSRVTALTGEHPEGISAAGIAAAFPGRDVHTCLSGLVAAGRVTRVRRGVYVAAEPADVEAPACGVKPVTVRTTLTIFTMMVQSFADEGRLARNPIALVERPTGEHGEVVTKSWTVTEVETFRESVRAERLFAC